LRRLPAPLLGGDRRIGRRLIVWVVASGAAVALCFTAVQLAVEYRELRGALDRQLGGVGIYVESLEGSLWDFDEKQIQRVIDALVLVPGVARVRVTEADTGREWSAGKAPSSGALARVVPLHHEVRGEEREIGTVELVASVEGIRRQVIARAATTLASTALLTAVVALVMVFLIRRLVTARLERMAARVRALAPGLLPAGPASAPRPIPAALDELDAVDWALTRATEDLAAAVAALRRSEEQLRQSQKLEAVGRLAAGVAHDFNNLLTAVLADAELLAQALPSEGVLRESALEIQTAAQRAALLTRQLLAFGRRQAAQPQVLDLDEVVGAMERMLRRLIGEDVELVTARAPGLWRVRADPGQIEQVIVNLAVNARDAMPDGGRLTLETANVERGPASDAGAAARPCVRLAVRDTGTGMTAEVRAHLFEPFFTTKAPGKGTGLGLSTVYGIVKQCGGEVSVTSEPEKGSVFEVYLPRVEAAGPRRAPPAATVHAWGTETVLVVDDEPMVLSTAVRMLRAAGYEVLAARDGDEALVLAGGGSRKVELLVTDVVLPRMDGREVAARLRAALPGLPVLFVSGYTDRAVDLAPFEGAAAFLAKPFTSGELTTGVRALLDRAKGGLRDA
jgi:signal transduction histidine kinase/CheY-like chemotaxis protein